MFSFEQPKVVKNQTQELIKKNLDNKGPLIAQLQFCFPKIEMAATPAPSVVKTMN